MRHNYPPGGPEHDNVFDERSAGSAFSHGDLPQQVRVQEDGVSWRGRGGGHVLLTSVVLL